MESSGSATTTPPSYKFTATVEHKGIPTEIDTGSSVTLLSSTVFSKLEGQTDTLKPATVILKSYTEDIIECLGEKNMRVQIVDRDDTLLIRVVQGPSLLGRDQKIPILSKVLHFTQHGWPEKPKLTFQPYYSKRLDLTHKDGILLWISKVVIPETVRSLQLRDLHAEHLGMV